MKLRNKKTGEIGRPSSITIDYEIALVTENKIAYYYDSLDKLYEEWEDYEEPKTAFIINTIDPGMPENIEVPRDSTSLIKKVNEEIGNYFETKEEAELAVRKLQAWKRLKDKGFKFKTWGWENKSRHSDYCVWFTLDNKDDAAKDLDLLFGGEE